MSSTAMSAGTGAAAPCPRAALRGAQQEQREELGQADQSGVERVLPHIVHLPPGRDDAIDSAKDSVTEAAR